MTNLVIHLFFVGAIAFVPNSTLDPDEMTAYLVKISHDSCVHYPFLSFELTEGKTCTGEDIEQKQLGAEVCNPFSGGRTCCTEYYIGIPELELPPLCVCGLANADVILDPPSQRRVKSFRQRPGVRLPQGEGDEADLTWLLRVANINSSASQIKSWGQIKDIPRQERPVIARLSFGWEDAQSCHIDQNYILGDGMYEVNNFDFVKYEAPDDVKSEHQQALAESVEFTSFLPVQPVRIVLQDLDRPEDAITLKLDCSGRRCPDLLIGNSASTLTCLGHYRLGYHFADYYQLSKNERAERIIPRRKRDLVTVSDEFSCGAFMSVGRRSLRMNPISNIHVAIESELVNLLNACSPPAPVDLNRLLMLIDVFGVDSAGLEEVLENLEAVCQNSFGNLNKIETIVGLSPIEQFILKLRAAVSSRVICPMAVFDP